MMCYVYYVQEDLKAAHTVVARHEDELQRRKHAMQELTTENRCAVLYNLHVLYHHLTWRNYHSNAL